MARRRPNPGCVVDDGSPGDDQASALARARALKALNERLATRR